jgi:hypothetical protein
LRTGTAGFFSGGKAPACWQRQIERSAAAPKAIERACRWLEEMAGPPKLHGEPLLGRCLPELLDAPPATEEPAPAEEPRQPRRATKPPAPATSQKKRPPRPQAHDPEHADSFAPAKQPARATHALLEQHAAPRKGRSRRGQADVLPQRPVRKSALWLQKPAQGAAGKGQAATATGHGGAWAGRLVERVRRRALGHDGETERRSGSPGRLPAELAGAGERPAGGLTAQWERLLSGQTFSAEQLEQMATGRVTRQRRTSGKGNKGRLAAGDKPADQAQQDDRPAAGSAGRRRSGAQTLSGRRRAGRGRPGSWNGEAHENAVAVEPAGVHEMGRYEPVDERSLAATRFQPPQMAERLPPLRPPLPNGLAIPAAAAAAARSARDEGAAAGDDLDELARKLNRILEEESRRFGIDV